MQDDIELKDWDGEEHVDLRQVWNVIDRRKWAILAFALLASLVAALFVVTMTPIYKATATILIESKQANVVSIEEIYGLDMRNQQYYDTQFEILRSRPIAETVVQSADLGTREVRLARNPDTGTGLAGKARSLKHRIWQKYFAGRPGESKTSSFQEMVESYARRLEIEPVGKTQLVKVHFQSQDPELAAEIANAHAKAYIDSVLDARVEVTQSASSWMATRVEDLRVKLSEAEQNLQAYREKEGLIDAQGVQSLPARELNELTSRLVAAKQRLSIARITYQQVQASAGQGTQNLEGVPTVMKDQAVQRFRAAEAEAEQKVAELARRYGPKHPKMIAAQSELEKTSENLRRQQLAVGNSIEADYRAAQSDVAQLERDLNAAKGRYQDVGRKESRLAELQRDVDTNRQLYDMFYSRMKETSQTGGLEAANARIMSPAIRPIYPFKPKKKLIVGLIFVVSTIFGIIAAFLAESLNNTIRSSDDVEEKLQKPLLGMLPLLRNGKKSGPDTGHAFFNDNEGEFSEAIRTIRTGISLSSIDAPYKVIMVGSSVSNEGKSTSALNLAFAFGQVEKVLVIDADLRRPTVGKELQVARSHPGVTDLLAGTATLNQCIVRRGREGVDVLATGFIPPNPLELLSSPRFGQIVSKLKESYERIIIDSPPVLPVSDAVVLSRFADSVVFVVKADQTSVLQIRHALRKLERVEAPVTGIVLNMLDLKKAEKYSDYGYGGYYESYGSDKAEVAPVATKEKAELAKVWANPKINRRRKVS